MQATSNLIDQEKMAIILEEVCGTAFDERFYPTFSGVARSLNYYPIGEEEAGDGIANVALGLGKYIVDGGTTLRFSPKHPKHLLQMSSLNYALSETQTHFLALDLKNKSFRLKVDDGQNLLELPISEAEKDGNLKFLASTFDPLDQVIRDGLWEGGRKIISFAHILQNDVFPLADILSKILKLGEQEMGRPIEIEFAVDFHPRDEDDSPEQRYFYLLQIRPIVDTKEMLDEDLDEIPEEQLLIKTISALGHGIVDDIYDLIFIKPELFSSSNNQLCVHEIEKINKQLGDEGRNYILIGPGRWGSSDSWMGIPVRWSQISNARLIVETGLRKYQIDPSQGTHFFQNLTSFGVHYYSLPNSDMAYNYVDYEYIHNQPALFENQFLKHVRFENPLVFKTDGKKGKGVLLKANRLSVAFPKMS